jgi:hypothetical protein
MVSLPTRETGLRRTASCVTRRTFQTGTALRRATAYHRNQTLFLAIVENLGCSGSLFLIKGPIQAALLINGGRRCE